MLIREAEEYAMRLVTLMFGVSLLTIVCSESTLSQDSTENAVEVDTLLHLSVADSTALEGIKALIENGQYAEAEAQARELLAEVKAEHGLESLEATEVLDQLVESLWRGGKTAEPESQELAERAVAVKEKLFGPENLKVAKSLHNLAVLHYYGGRYAQAEPLHERALSIREEALGPDHPDVAKSLNNQAILYWRQGKYAEAEQRYKRALAIWEKEFGPDHPRVAESLNNLALLYRAQGKYAEAEPLHKRALAIKEKALGPDHADVAASLNNLAVLYVAQGKYAEAEPLHKRALAIQEKALGPDHPDGACSLNNLALLYRAQGKYAEAEPLCKRALAFWEKALGPDHPDVAISLNSLAILYWEQGKYAEAEPLHKRALAIREKALGLEHPDVAQSLNSLAVLYIEQGKYAEAEPLYKRALSIWEKALGLEHPDVAQSLNNLANLYRAQGKYAEAEPLHKRALAIREKVLGLEQPDVAQSLSNLANLYAGQGKYAEAEPLHKRALAIKEKALGPDHPDVAISLNNLAVLYKAQGKYAEAEPLHKRALAINQEALGTDHPQVASHLESYSHIHRLQSNTDQALEMVERAVGIRRKNFIDNAFVLSEKDALTYSRYLRNSVGNYLSCYLELGSIDRAATAEVADVVFSSKGQVSDGMFERQRIMVKETDSTTVALAESLRLAKFRLSQLFVEGPGEELEKYQDEVDSLGGLANELEADLSRHSGSFRKKQDYENVSAERIASMLPENSVLVEYLKYDYQQLVPDSSIPRYLAVVMTYDGEPVITDLGEASEIDPLVDRYRKHMSAASRAGRMPTVVDQHNYKEIIEEFYIRVWQPIEKFVADKELVLIAPGGGLNMVSFAGLMDGDGRYLIEKHAVHHMSAGRDVIRFKQEAEPGSGLFALGDPDYDATALARLSIPEGTPSDSLPEPDLYAVRNTRSGCGKLKDITVNPLPFTRSEVESVAESWAASSDEPVAVYFGSNASEEKFKVEASGKRVIHLATHGYFLEGACQPDLPKRGIDADVGFVGENPLLLSGLFFAGANLHGEGADSVGAEDGILTAYEVSAMDLEGTELAVLSACETGLGEVKEGEGVYGLRRAFQMAGARTVISALWPVSDRVTADMMSQLYNRQGESLPETLRRLQLESINKLRGKKKADHPFSWGAFIALGDWR